jgi:hypothetical protein
LRRATWTSGSGGLRGSHRDIKVAKERQCDFDEWFKLKTMTKNGHDHAN